METIRIKSFKGLNKKVNPSDIADNQAQELKNFWIDSEIGTLKKITGYSDYFSDYPSGLSIKSMFQFLVSSPSEQEIYVVYGQDGSRDEIWIRPYWDSINENWVDSWQELTEAEGTLTAGPGTDTTHIVCSGFSSSEDDYYAGWIVTSDARNTQTRVLSYDGSTKTLTLAVSISGQTSGDTFRIERFNLYFPFESGSLGSGTTTTVAYISGLKAKTDDYYIGWNFYNSTVGAYSTVSDYDPVAGKITLSSAITGQASGDGFELYYGTPPLSVDDKIRFTQRPDALIMSVGNNSGYPTQAPLWFGYINRRYFSSDNNYNNDFNGFYLCRNVLDKPDSSIIGLTDVTGDLGDTYPDTYYVRASFIYDGYQESPLSDAQSISIGATKSLNIEIHMTLDNGYNNYYSYIMNRRITGVRVYVAKGADADTNWEYYFLYQFVIASDNPELLPISNWNGSLIAGHFYSQDVTMNADGWSNKIYDPDIPPERRDTSSTDANVARRRLGGTSSYLTVNRGDYWDVIQGHNSIYIDANYKYAALVQGRSFIAPIFTDKKHESLIAFSTINGYGNMCPDIYPRLNFISANDYGIRKINGLALMIDRLIIFSESDILKLMINPASEFSWELDETYQDVGCVAPDSIEYIEGIVFYLSKDGVRYFDGNTSHLVYGTYGLFDDFTTTSDAFGIYNKKLKQYWIAFPTEGKIYAINIVSNDMYFFEFELADSLIWAIQLHSNDILFTDGSNIYQLDDSLTLGSWTNKIVPLWKSKAFNGGAKDVEMILRRVSISYKSNTPIKFNYYRNFSSTAATALNSAFQANTTEKNIVAKFPLGERGTDYEFEITLDSDYEDTNNYLTINEIAIDYDIEKNRFQ